MKKVFLFLAAAGCCLSLMASNDVTYASEKDAGVAFTASDGDTIRFENGGWMLLDASNDKLILHEIDYHPMDGGIQIDWSHEFTIQVEGECGIEVMGDESTSPAIKGSSHTKTIITGDQLLLESKLGPVISTPNGGTLQFEDVMLASLSNNSTTEPAIQTTALTVINSNIMAGVSEGGIVCNQSTATLKDVQIIDGGLDQYYVNIGVDYSQSHLKIYWKKDDSYESGMVDSWFIANGVTYDLKTNTLTLNNCKFDGAFVWTTWVEDETFNIHVIGDCEITSGPAGIASIYSHANYTKIYSTPEEKGSLTIINETANGIYCYDASELDLYLNIENLNLYVESKADHAFYARGGYDGYAHLEAVAPDNKYAISPASQSFASAMKKVYDWNNHHVIYAYESEIENVGLTIDGNEVNQFNAFDILQDNEMKLVYDLEANRLDMKGVGVGTVADTAIVVSRPITINSSSVDMNSIGGDEVSILAKADITITGSQELHMYRGIVIKPVDKDITVTFDQLKEFMISDDIVKGGESDKNAYLHFRNTKGEFTNVKNIKDITFTNCNLQSGLEFDGEYILDKDMCEPADLMDPESGENCPKATTSRVESVAYPLSVKGTIVTSANANNILPEVDNDGLIRYDNATKTLYIGDGARIEASNVGYHAIDIDDTDLKIVFEGSGTLISHDDIAIVMTGVNHTLELNAPTIDASGNIYSESALDKPVIDVSNDNNIKFTGLGEFEVEELYATGANTSLIVANNMTIDAILYLYSEDTYSTTNVTEGVSKIILNEHMQPGDDFVITDGELVWKNPSTNPILEVYFSGIPLQGVNLLIKGYDVNERNKDDILGDGKVRYDVANDVLILDNATIESNSVPAIQRTDELELAIEVYGDCHIFTKTMDAVIAYYMSIKGKNEDAHLSIDMDMNDEPDFYTCLYTGGISSVNLVIEDIALEATILNSGSNVPAIWCNNGGLSIKNADVRAAVESNVLEPYALNAITCPGLELKGENMDIRFDDVVWKMVSWNEESKLFEGSDCSHIWIGRAEFPTAMDNMSIEPSKAIKVLHDGQILIIYNGRVYNMMGIVLQ